MQDRKPCRACLLHPLKGDGPWCAAAATWACICPALLWRGASSDDRPQATPGATQQDQISALALASQAMLLHSYIATASRCNPPPPPQPCPRSDPPCCPPSCNSPGLPPHSHTQPHPDPRAPGRPTPGGFSSAARHTAGSPGHGTADLDLEALRPPPGPEVIAPPRPALQSNGGMHPWPSAAASNGRPGGWPAPGWQQQGGAGGRTAANGGAERMLFAGLEPVGLVLRSSSPRGSADGTAGAGRPTTASVPSVLPWQAERQHEALALQQQQLEQQQQLQLLHDQLQLEGNDVRPAGSVGKPVRHPCPFWNAAVCIVGGGVYGG